MATSSQTPYAPSVIFDDVYSNTIGENVIGYPEFLQRLVDIEAIKPGRGVMELPSPKDSMSNRTRGFYKVAKEESKKLQQKYEFRKQILFNTSNRNPRVYKVLEAEMTPSVENYGSSSGTTKLLRYFTVRNRADGNQFSEEREIHLARSLVNPIDKIDLAKEEDRLRSFEGWRFEDTVKGSQLAARGFYHLGDSDRVQCVFCKGVLRDWSKGDDALREHHRHFPTCPFILKLDVGNVPMDHTPYNVPFPKAQCTEKSPTEYKPSLPCSDSTISLFAHDESTLVSQIKYPQFQDPKKRFDSFFEGELLPTWPVVSAVTAGFFNDTQSTEAGEEDQISVRCFACDLSLKQPRDLLRPNVWWDEHISNSRLSCPYVRLCRREPVRDRAPGLSLAVQKTLDLYPTMSTLQHRVEMREIRSRVDLPLYYTLQKMGHSRELLIYIVQRRLENMGVDFDSIVDVFEHLMIYEREFSAKKQQKPELSVQDYVRERKEEIEKKREEVKTKMLQNSLSTGSSDREEPAGNTNLLENYDDEALKEMNRQLKDDRTCKICMDHIVNTVFLPCGHLVTCHECAPRVKTCPVCRLPITSTVLTTM